VRSLKTLIMSGEGYVLADVDISESLSEAGGFQLSISGRFLVSTDGLDARKAPRTKGGVDRRFSPRPHATHRRDGAVHSEPRRASR
jgi:hypothetical protein